MNPKTKALVNAIGAVVTGPEGATVVEIVRGYVEAHGRASGRATYSEAAGALLDWYDAGWPDVERYMPTRPGNYWRRDDERVWAAEVLEAYDGQHGLVYYDRGERTKVADDGRWVGPATMPRTPATGRTEEDARRAPLPGDLWLCSIGNVYVVTAAGGQDILAGGDHTVPYRWLDPPHKTGRGVAGEAGETYLGYDPAAVDRLPAKQ